jgi:Lrp/AsnC family leucine-responsive transcriptional regulator
MLDQDLLDEIDRTILDLLRLDARRTVTDIAGRVNLTPAPVKRRIERLERLGVIAGYTVVADRATVGPPLEAFTEVRVAGHLDLEEAVAFAVELPEVQEAFTTTGEPDVLLRLRVDDVAHLHRVVNALRVSTKITGTRTLVVLDRWTRQGGEPGEGSDGGAG